MTRFLITGVSGLLGINLALDLTAAGHEVVGTVNSHPLGGAPFEQRTLDLTAPNALAPLLDEVSPDVVVHCAALANLEACEADPQKAQAVNADLPGRLAQETARRGIQLVHISTDAVFDGARGNYAETDAPYPRSVYARTKLAGEAAVLAADVQAVVARVNFFGWSLNGRRSLSEFFFNNLSAGKRVNGFVDVLFCPLYVLDLGRLLVEMTEHRLSGLYHTTGSETLSKYDFGAALAQRFGLDAGLITPISVHDSELTAPRSPNLTLSTAKLAAALGHALPGVSGGLDRFAADYHAGYTERLRAMGTPS
jgi:dTDP-4-dehydrorhamnose reductase